MFLPYNKNLSEKISKLLRPYNINCSFRLQLPYKKKKTYFVKLNVVYLLLMFWALYITPCRDCDLDYAEEIAKHAIYN